MLVHPTDYKNVDKDPWDFEGGNTITEEIRQRQPKQSRSGYVNTEATTHLLVDDFEHPYNEDKRFDWIRVPCGRKVIIMGKIKLETERY